MNAWRRYQHVISLGHFCGVASELERFGLRDASYPFDWIICELQPALELMESGLGELLERGVLSRQQDHPHIVQHPSGVSFYHDFRPECSIDEQLAEVGAKYARRMARLQASVQERTLFVRYVIDSAEFEYLEKNMPAVLSVLRRGHPRNDLLLIGNATLPATCGDITMHRVEADEGDMVAREFLRKNKKLGRTLLWVNYPVTHRIRNYLWHMRRPEVLPGVASRMIGEGPLHDLLGRIRSVNTTPKP